MTLGNIQAAAVTRWGEGSMAVPVGPEGEVR